MHILVTTDTLGGVWTYTRELVTGLVQRGISVTLVSFGRLPTRGQVEWMKGLLGLDYRPTEYKLEWMENSESDIRASERYLEAIIHERRPDLLHSNQFCYGAVECDVPRVVVAHSDVVSWWLAVRQREPVDSAWTRWYRNVVTMGVSAATVVSAPSQWMLDQIARHYVQPAIGQVIYNGRTPTLFDPDRQKENFIMSVGRHWDEGKNTALLLQCRPPVPVCIVGADRHPESQGSAFVRNQDLPRVMLAGEKDEVELSRLLAKASIYAATSCYEPFGLAPLEAALSGCAIVASDLPSFRELWDGAALFFSSGDADGLHAALEQLAANPDLCRSYGELALARARQRFGASRMVDEHVALYVSLIAASAIVA